MEMHQVRYFLAAAKHLNFTKAASRLHLAQPSLTRQIHNLEEEIGVRLLDRTKQKVSLTDEGRSFLADAKRVLNLAEEIVESVQRLSRREVTALNIGYVANLFYDLLPVTLASFQRSYSTVSINLFDMTCGDQFRAIEDGKIDLGFVGLREAVAERGLQFRPIATYRVVAALPKDNPVANKPVVKLKELEPMFSIGMSESSYPGYRRWLTGTCQRVGFSPKVLQDADIERTVIQSVAAGLGVALLPEQVKKLPHERVVFRPLKPAVATESCIAWKPDNRSSALKAYVDIVSEVGSKMR
jgi:DNA-binding transcriptional LysR family regulator